MFNQEELIKEYLITVNHMNFLFDFLGFPLFRMKMALAYTNYGDCRVIIQILNMQNILMIPTTPGSRLALRKIGWWSF